MRPPVSLRARLTAVTAFLLAVAVCAGFVGAWFIVQSQLRGEIDNALSNRARTFAASGNRTRPAPITRAPRGVAPPRLGEAAGYIQFVQANGHVRLAPNEKVRLPSDGAREVAAGQRASFFRDATVDGTHVRIYTTNIKNGTALQIARPLTEVDAVLSRVRLLFIAVSILAVTSAAAVGLFLSRTALRPVRRLTEHAERIAATGDLSQRTNESRSDELGRLAVAFNTMLDALADSVQAQRQLVADASHELRTPLAAARTNLEVLELHDDIPAAERRRILADATDELKEMTQLIEELVELARGDAQILERQPIRLDHIAEESVAVAARRSGREFRAELSPTVVDGSPAALGRAISNLIDNALKWGPPGTPVEVSVRDGVVAVRDHGPGIAADDLPHVFDRFYRATTARTLPGSGLGLAIVRQIADAHGGMVTAAQAPGGGSLFTLRVPLLESPTAEELALVDV
jgi:two-component system sensor histidine kinase MprB